MARKRPTSSREKREGTSVLTMVFWMMVFVAWLSWAIAASAYFDALPVAVGGRAGFFVMVVSFLWNSLRIDAMPAVFMNSLRHHQWHLMLFVVLEAMTAGFGLWAKWLESELDRPHRKRKRKR